MLAAALAACGDGEAIPPKVPVAGGGQVGTGDLTGTPQQGQQWTAGDEASSSGIDMNRPQMSSEAAGYYQQGVQAFVGGNLAGARDGFSKASQADSKAYQAFYSLGVVQERLKDKTGAAASYERAYTIVPSYEPAIVAAGIAALFGISPRFLVRNWSASAVCPCFALSMPKATIAGS